MFRERHDLNNHVLKHGHDGSSDNKENNRFPKKPRAPKQVTRESNVIEVTEGTEGQAEETISFTIGHSRQVVKPAKRRRRTEEEEDEDEGDADDPAGGEVLEVGVAEEEGIYVEATPRQQQQQQRGRKKKAKKEEDEFEELELVCGTCGESFDNQLLYDVHLKDHLEEEKPFGCTQCPKRFLTQQYLNAHMQVRHQGASGGIWGHQGASRGIRGRQGVLRGIREFQEESGGLQGDGQRSFRGYT